MNYLSAYFLVLLIITGSSNIVGAEDMLDIFSEDIKGENKQLSLKYRMASYLIHHSPIRRRIKLSNNKDLKSLFDAAKFNFGLVETKINEKKWIEANAIIDSVIRDLSNISRMLNQKKIERDKYTENVKKVNSFTMPEWTDLSNEEVEFLKLNLKKIESLVKQSANAAKNENYLIASNFLDQAYKLKSQLLMTLKHESTVVYDLFFDSPEEEFSYMLKRSTHYLELVNNLLKNNQFNKAKMNLITVYVEEAEAGIEKALMMEKDKQHESAVIVLDKSIKNLSGTLKIMGVRP
ncbi:hypothetical protein MNBD_GAMMA22-1947 [hydrothermal vent metagenome]|uniref:Uncharacterized protein n=1 Tax=hydrothermal vent metagenome TaxID=652676 RepID=A0A3B1A6N5_9ZZZZ